MSVCLKPKNHEFQCIQDHAAQNIKMFTTLVSFRSSAHVEAPSLKIIIKEMEELKTHLTHINSPVVLCHNDLLTKNVIYNQEEGDKHYH